MKKLTCFDFDGTLCDTKEMSEGKLIWEEKNGKIWPYRGWWGRVESIDWNTFKTKTNPWVYEKYLEEVRNSDYVILATGRSSAVPDMKRSVELILSNNNLSFSEIEIDGQLFDGVFLNPGGDTYKFKTKLFEYLISKLNIDIFSMYDDRQEHLIRFIDWAKTQQADINIIDVINKTSQTFKNKNI